ncbi:MAG: hypothetical protein ACXACF_07690 [Candidatus Hermodarchaeia archaeon]|jgi:hypothetical protein
MTSKLNRRSFIKKSILTSAGSALTLQLGSDKLLAQDAAEKPTTAQSRPTGKARLQKGRIGNLRVSRLMLGGNLLTHFTHSRDLKYVYNLTAHYNTEEKIHETMAIAEAHGIDTLVIHTAPGIMSVLSRGSIESL